MRSSRWVFAVALATVGLAWGLAVGPATSAQAITAVQLRTQALALRTEANTLREQAAAARAEAEKQRQIALDARVNAADARAKKDAAAAQALEGQATNATSLAEASDTRATDLIAKAVPKEELASQRESDARALEVTSQSAADQLYRKLRAAARMGREELISLKTHQSSRVGKPSMDVRLIRSHIHDEHLKTFGFADLHMQFRPYEESVAALAATIETDRNALAAGKMGVDFYNVRAYRLIQELVGVVEMAMFRLTARGYDTYEAVIYKMERACNQEWRSNEEALAASNFSVAQKEASRNILRAKHSVNRRGAFMEVGKGYRMDKNVLALFVTDWSQVFTDWHALANRLTKGDDDHRWGATSMTRAITYYFTTNNGSPMTVGNFAYVPGSIDRFNAEYSDYDWCKARPFPDIQPEGDPGMFRMHAILEKHALLSQGGKLDGAAKSIRP